MKTIPAG